MKEEEFIEKQAKEIKKFWNGMVDLVRETRLPSSIILTHLQMFYVEVLFEIDTDLQYKTDQEFSHWIDERLEEIKKYILSRKDKS